MLIGIFIGGIASLSFYSAYNIYTAQKKWRTKVDECCKEIDFLRFYWRTRTNERFDALEDKLAEIRKDIRGAEMRIHELKESWDGVE